MKVIAFTMDIEIEVEVEGGVKRGLPSGFDQLHGNFIPAEPDDVDARVFLVRTTSSVNGKTALQRLEITDWLLPDELAEVEDELMANFGGED